MYNNSYDINIVNKKKGLFGQNMNLLMKQAKNDIKQGILCEYMKYVVVLAIMIFLTVDFTMRVGHGFEIGKIDTGTMSITDVLLSIFKGMEEYNPNSKMQFEMPMSYILLNVFLAFIIGNYPMKDLLGFGKNVLVRSKDRASWWMSKCIWNIAAVTSFYGILLIVILITCGIKGNFSVEPTVSICTKITGINITQETQYVDIGLLLLTVYVLPILTSLALSMFQMAMAFITSPVISYMIIIAILVGAAFYNNQFLPGNYFMMLRNQTLLENGFHTYIAVIFDSFLFIVSAIAGYLYFRKCDILEKHGLI